MPPLSDAELTLLEDRMGYSMPAAYRSLLTRLGPGKHGHLEIYHPCDVAALYAHHFETPAQLFEV